MRELLHRNPAPDKTQDSLTWVQHMNSLKTQAEEIVLSEIVYSIGCGQAGLMESACSSQSSFCGFLTRQKTILGSLKIRFMNRQNNVESILILIRLIIVRLILSYPFRRMIG